MTLRIAVDLDGTICETKREGQPYADVLPLPGAIETLQSLKDRGYYIVIFTARNMRTYNGNLGAIIRNQAKTVIDWLDNWEVPYDELLFGKPHVDYFIDDKALPFKGNWSEMKEILLSKEPK